MATSTTVAKPSPDILKLCQFELDNGNTVIGHGARADYNFTLLDQHFHKDVVGFTEAVGETLLPWSKSDPHYGEDYEGYRSTLFPNGVIVFRKIGGLL